MSSVGGKILVIRGGAIGDFILTLPAIAALRERFPEARLEVLGYPHIVNLALAGGLVNGVRPIEAGPLAGFFARHGTLAEAWSDYFAEFDLILSYLYDPDEIFQTNIRRCSPAQFIAGPHRPAPDARTPAAQLYLQPMERLAIFDTDPVPRLRLEGSRMDCRQLALHPGSGSERKNWPEPCWANLIRQLLSTTDLELLLVGGEAEGERLERLASVATNTRARVKLAQNVPLTELAAQLASCVGFVGHDSGISHLAAAVGLRGLVLWGDSIEEIWRPPSGKVSILRHAEGLAALPVNLVQERIRNLWLSAEEID